METTTLRNGTTVLAKTDRHGYFGPVQYTNYAQALTRVEKLRSAGINGEMYEVRAFSRVKYIRIND